MQSQPREEGSSGDERFEKRHVFELRLPPLEISRLLRRGVTVFDSGGKFEERAFGEMVASGKTLFRIVK